MSHNTQLIYNELILPFHLFIFFFLSSINGAVNEATTTPIAQSATGFFFCVADGFSATHISLKFLYFIIMAKLTSMVLTYFVRPCWATVITIFDPRYKPFCIFRIPIIKKILTKPFNFPFRFFCSSNFFFRPYWD